MEEKKKSVAIFSNYFWTVYNFRKPLILELIKNGYSVTAIAAPDEYTDRTRALGCNVILMKQLDPKSTGYLQELKLVWEIIQTLRKLECTYIFTFTIKPNLFATITSFVTGKKTIMTINGRGNFFSGDHPSRFLLYLFKLSFSQTKKIIFQNKDDYQFFHSRKMLRNDKVIFVRGSGVSTSLFSYSNKVLVPGKEIIFLMACRLLQEKGVFEYLEAASNIKQKYPKVCFRLLGVQAKNPSAISMDALLPYKKSGVIETLNKTDDINSLLEEVDVLVLPSYYNEGVPKILLEGLSKGLPIITTDWVGCKETVTNNVNGYLIEPRSVTALESALEKIILLEPGERSNMRLASRHLAETEFEEAKVLQAYLCALE